MSDNKDKNYNETAQKKDEKAVANAVKSRDKVCGIQAFPGEHFQAGVITVTCPHCKAVGATDVKSGWNMKAYLCCYYYGAYFWCHQIYYGKDFTLKDGVHSCKSCQKEIHTYTSC